MAETKKLLRKLALFSLPFLAYVLIIVVVDPYNFLPGASPISDDLKLQVSYKLNYAMWKMTEFANDPVPNILLGDSRMNSLSAKKVSAVSGRTYYNFAYGGGSLREGIDTFHFAHDLTHLEHVCIGVNLSIFNGSNLKDRVQEVLAARRNPLIYLVNRNVMNAAFRLLGATLTGREPTIGKPRGDKDEFWKFQLDVTTKAFFDNYQEPAEYRAELTEVAETCRRDGIDLRFIIFPGHQDLQDRIAGYGLTQADARMRDFLKQLGPVYDFSWPNALTANREQFTDPYHYGHQFGDLIIEDVWGDRDEFVRKYGQVAHAR